MLTYIRNFILSKNFYLILFTFWTIKQFFYFYDTLDIYKNVSLIFIIVFSAILFLAVLSIFNILNKKEFFQYFSIIFFLLIISNFFYDVSKDHIKQKRQEIFIKEILKEKNKYHSFDFRTQKAVVEDLRKENNNKNIYQAILPNFFFKEPKFFTELLPLSGISNATTVLCNESGEYSIYQSDRYGFNNPDINYDNNTKEISYGGNGPLLELATLIEYIHVLKPKIVIWFYAENDLPNLVIEKKSKFLMQYLRKNNFTQNLSQRQNEIDLLWKKILNQNLDVVDYLQVTKKKTFLRNFLRKIERAFLLKPMRDFLKFYYEKELIQHYETVHKDHLHLYSEILTKVKEISNNHNSSLYFVYLPFLSSVVENTRTKKEIINIVNQLGIQIIDFHEYLKNENKPESFFPLGKHGHYNDRGYKELSNLISSHLN